MLRPATTLLDYRRRALLVCAVLLVAYIPLDLVIHQSRVGALVRAGWILTLLAARALQRPDRPRLSTASGLLAAGASGLGAVFTVASVGGGWSPRLGSLLALPLVVLAIAPEVPAAAGLTAVITVSGGAWLVFSAAGSPARVVEWAVVSGAIGAVSFHAALVFQKIWREGLENERRRATHAEALAESERQEGERRRVLEIGRMAADIAHEVNNPLAAAKTNARWLAEHGAGDEETRGAAEDLLAAMDRIAEAVAAMGRFAGELQEAGSAPPLDRAPPAARPGFTPGQPARAAAAGGAPAGHTRRRAGARRAR